MQAIGRRIDSIENEFERAVCERLYLSGRQRRQRWGLMLALGFKHTLRGVLFSWPLYLLALAVLLRPDGSVWLSLLLVPAVCVSLLILRRGIAEDYRRFLHRVLLKPGATRHILWPHD